jgi:hypothetical protein
LPDGGGPLAFSIAQHRLAQFDEFGGRRADDVRAISDEEAWPSAQALTSCAKSLTRRPRR